ncbi:MAG: hypothetical protein ACOC95_05295 [Planctomycetota bacterium]
MRRVTMMGLVIALAATFATAQTVVVEDFESGWDGVGVVEMDPTNASNALYLDAGEYVEIALPNPGAGVLTVDMYDMGWLGEEYSDDIQGPRWGVAGTDPTTNAVTAAMMHKPFLAGDSGYAWSGEVPGTDVYTQDGPNNGPSSVFNWFGPFWMSFPRQSMAWSTWTFTVDAAGLVTITADFTGKSVATTTGLTDAAQYFVACGGSASNQSQRWFYNGFYIDNIAWTPADAPTCADGDADCDGDVDLDDFVLLKNNFGTTEGATWEMGDFDADGDVDLDDFVILKNNFGS